MARRVQTDLVDPREWSVRAAEAFEHAEAMPPGPKREEALRRADQLRTAAEMKGYLSSNDLKSPA